MLLRLKQRKIMKLSNTISLKRLKYALVVMVAMIVVSMMIPTGQLFAQEPEPEPELATASLDVTPAPAGQETLFDVHILDGMGGWFQIVVYGAEEYDQWVAGGYNDPQPASVIDEESAYIGQEVVGGDDSQPGIVFNDGIGNQPPETGIPSDDFSETYSHIFSEGGDYVARVFGSTTGGIPTFFSDDQYFTIEEKPKTSAPPEEPAPWVRDRDMTCFQVWVNEDNNFEFVFWWVYADNNWVQIYDMEGNLAWEVDFEKDKPQFEADLPDGMYTVKTFHEAGHILQEFIIGKP